MSASAFAGILGSIVDILQAAHPGLRVYANRTRAVSVEEAQCIVVRLENTRRDETGPLGCADWQTLIQVECLSRVATGTDPAAGADALLATAWAALLSVPLGLPDVQDLDASPEIAWDYDAAETPLVSASFRLTVRHRTHANSLTPWSI